MVVLFIVIANEVLKCYGMRFCEPGSATELTRLWQIGLVEVMFEGIVGGTLVKVWRRINDKTASMREDRSDLIVNTDDEDED